MIRDPWLRALSILGCAIAGFYLVGLLWQVVQEFADIFPAVLPGVAGGVRPGATGRHARGRPLVEARRHRAHVPDAARPASARRRHPGAGAVAADRRGC